jgi:20S proteasome alpha/beta subunit
MTIAAGFLCDDGIVIAADSEVQADSDKYNESKIFTLHPDSISTNPMAVFAGSGWLDFVKMAVDKIKFQALGVTHSYEVEDIIEKTVLEIHRKHIRYYSSSPKPYFSLIVGLRDEDGSLRIMQTSGTSITRVPRQVCIGAGQTLGSYLSRALNSSGLSMDTTATLATQILDQVKKNVPECGGMFSEVVLLPKQGPIRRLSPSRMLKIEYCTADLIAALKPSLLTLADPSITDAEFDAEMDSLNAECRKMRERQKKRMLI